jgi:hypothetical protein
MADHFIELQEDLFEYFKDVDDKTLVDFCDVFIFELGTEDSKISAFSEKFLLENGLVEAYLNYMREKQKAHKLFIGVTSDMAMIEDIKRALLVLSYNRLQRIIHRGSVNVTSPKAEPKVKKPTFDNLTKSEKADLRMVIEECERKNDSLLEDEDTTRDMFEDDEAEDLIAERNRLASLYPKVLKLLK